jgi:hypothetical protein
MARMEIGGWRQSEGDANSRGTIVRAFCGAFVPIHLVTHGTVNLGHADLLEKVYNVNPTRW